MQIMPSTLEVWLVAHSVESFEYLFFYFFLNSCLSLSPFHIFCVKDTMATMTPDIEDTMTSPTGLMMIAEGETATAINLCILPGMQRILFGHHGVVIILMYIYSE